VNYPSFIWNPLVESCGSLTLPPLDFSLEKTLSKVICLCLFLFNFCEIALSLNRSILLFATAILGCHFYTRRDDHVILCSTFEFLFEFQNQTFLKFFIRVSSCSNIKPFKVRGSTVIPPRFTAVFTRERQFPISCTVWIQSTPSHSVHVKPILM
jgi:hypothetical protein